MLCCFDEFRRSRTCRSTAVVTIIINAEEYWKIMLVAGKMSCVESHVIVAWLLLARCPALCYCTTLPHCNRRRRSYYAAPLAHCGLRYEKWTCMQLSWENFSNCEYKGAYLYNRRVCTLIAGKVCLLTLREAKRQTLPEISMHAWLLDS